MVVRAFFYFLRVWLVDEEVRRAGTVQIGKAVARFASNEITSLLSGTHEKTASLLLLVVGWDLFQKFLRDDDGE